MLILIAGVPFELFAVFDHRVPGQAVLGDYTEEEGDQKED